jgi:(1->4)-alpha-D-glucan 1-alpha-D-glucosylmutase
MSVRSSPTVLAPQYSGLWECLDRLAAQRRFNRPLSCYRLQFHRGFRFEDARRLIPYLHALGVTHLYASPILKARAGSTHGYDIVDHSQINPELGGEPEFQALVRELKAYEMGMLLDIVPNHMGVSYGDNSWWSDVLENGRASEYADYFDIDWQPFKSELRDKVLIPVLGDTYGAELEAGRIQLEDGGGRLRVNYYDKQLPVDPQTIPMVFETLGDLREQPAAIAPSDTERVELENILWEMRELPPHTISDPERIQYRQRQIPELKRRFCDLLRRSRQVHALVREAVRRCNGRPGEARSFDALHRLLEAQAYRLAYWRVSVQEINYRRFFDINDLAGLRLENPHVFAATHQLIRRLLADGSVNGLRVDHPDGLLNPIQYFTRLQTLYAASQYAGPEPQGPLSESGIEIDVQEVVGRHEAMSRQAPLYLLLEKILGPGEILPPDWPVDGTVGYDFVRLVNGIFIDFRNERALTNLYRRFVDASPDFDTLLYESKKLIMSTALSSELTVLSHILEEISGADRRARDFTRPALTEAIRETIACFPVYRTYVDERGNISEQDQPIIQEAIARAKRRNPGTATALFDWLREILLLRAHALAGAEWQRRCLRFALKFQQLTGPVMAKGLEDTVCYVYNRFLAVNEVGCTPAELGIPADEFHRGNQRRNEAWPFSMLETSTHDSKRSEDVRARLDVLSEMPREWSAQVMRWRRLNRTRKRPVADGRLVPDANEEYFLYQTLVGAWPLAPQSEADEPVFLRRMQQYMAKAAHEAKVNLSWVNPDPEYVAQLEGFLERILAPVHHGRKNFFRLEIERFLPAVMYFGAINSVAQALLKITVPGVPDIYQGNEIWDFSLVDPDNRRPVDFATRRELWEELIAAASGEPPWLSLTADILENWRNGKVKLWTTLRALRFRREHRELFQFGSYMPLPATGGKSEHVVAFAREYMGEAVMVVIPRLSYTLMRGQLAPPLGEVWGATELTLPAGYDELVNVLTGERFTISGERPLLCREIFAHFPVALLVAGGCRDVPVGDVRQ